VGLISQGRTRAIVQEKGEAIQGSSRRAFGRVFRPGQKEKDVFWSQASGRQGGLNFRDFWFLVDRF